MSVLFLDIDGVLNHRAWLIAHGSGADANMLDPACVARLNAIVDRTECAVVVSSAWRILHSVGELQRMLRSRGFTGRLRGRTPSSGQKSGGIWIGRERGHEIQAWMDDHSVDATQMAIVDDSDDMAHLAHRLVRTSFEHGMQDDHVEAIVAMLGAGA